MNFWFSAGFGAIVMAMIAFSLHSLDVKWIEARHESAMTAQAAKLSGQCATAKETTEKVSNDLQKNLTILDSDFDNIAGRLRACVQSTPTGLVSATTGGHDGAAAAQKLSEGISRAFAPGRVTAIVKKGEQSRVRLLACQAWAREVQQAAEKNSPH